VRAKLGSRMFERLLWLGASGVAAAAAGFLGLLLVTGKLNPWTGRWVWGREGRCTWIGDMSILKHGDVCAVLIIPGLGCECGKEQGGTGGTE
jgi:hypothetical protein